MPSLLLKRDVKSVVDGTTLLPGELATAIDTGDVYVGKADGSKQRMANDTDLDDLVIFGDDLISDPVKIDPDTIGPISLLATKINFTDGQTFQDKFVAGVFHGQQGAPGTPGAPGKDESIDLIIRTQEEFDALLASPTWLGANSVCFVGNGGTLRFQKTDGTGITPPATITHIRGMNGATIDVKGTNIDAFNGSNSPTISISDIFVVGYTGVRGGITSFANVINCPVNVETNSQGVYGIQYCNRVNNCGISIWGTSTADGIAFDTCANVSNCRASSSVTAESHITGYAYCQFVHNSIASMSGDDSQTVGFSGCDMIVNCSSEVSGVVAVGFNMCTRLTNCSASVTGRSSTSIAGFLKCNQLSNCTGNAKHEPFTTGLKAYCFQDCTWMNGCNGNNLDATKTIFLGGTNAHVDASTVVAGKEPS